MRLGYSPGGGRTGAQVLAAAAAAERLGLDELWISEDYLERGGFAVAGAVAAQTSTLTVGLGVVNPSTRHPALVAMEFAALDELSGGRAVLGLGTSNRFWMTDLLGLPFDRPLSRLTEAVRMIRALLRGEPVEHDGDFFRVAAGLSFRPLRSDPPIVLGVKGDRALRASAGLADGVLLPVLSSPAYIRWAADRVGDAGLTGYVVFGCGPDRDAVRAQAKLPVAHYLGLHGTHPVTATAGLDPELGKVFADRMRAGDPAVELVTDQILDTFAVVGDRDDCAAGLAALAGSGLHTAVLTDDAEADPASTLRLFTECAREAGLTR